MPYKYDWQKILTAAVVVVVLVLVWKMSTRESYTGSLPYSHLQTAYPPVPAAQMQEEPGSENVNSGVIEAAKAPMNLPYSLLTGSDVAPVKKACTCAIKGACGGGDVIQSTGKPLLAANEVDNYVSFSH